MRYISRVVYFFGLQKFAKSPPTLAVGCDRGFAFMRARDGVMARVVYAFTPAEIFAAGAAHPAHLHPRFGFIFSPKLKLKRSTRAPEKSLSIK